jgi:hypothetical protein
MVSVLKIYVIIVDEIMTVTFFCIKYFDNWFYVRKWIVYVKK